MSTLAQSTIEDKRKPMTTNRIGLSVDDYKGAQSTLCKGCGHDAITSSIIKSFFEMGVPPHRIAKLSGIGCSSKTPNYFSSKSHGFNGVHGRMAALACGVSAANRNLVNIGVSGDGDTASIGIGHFSHMIRRNIPIVYVIENNGVYGLTKGQFSATADQGAVKKDGRKSLYEAVDCCALAMQMGCGFVARSFSGDTKQLQTLLKAAIAYEGTAVIDILSPCVTFNNHEGSTRSIAFARSNENPLHAIGFIPSFEEIAIEYGPGESRVVQMHDGSKLRLQKLEHNYDASDFVRAMSLLDKARVEHLFFTGLLYYREERDVMSRRIKLVDEPLAELDEERIRPSRETFAQISEMFL